MNHIYSLPASRGFYFECFGAEPCFRTPRRSLSASSPPSRIQGSSLCGTSQFLPVRAAQVATITTSKTADPIPHASGRDARSDEISESRRKISTKRPNNISPAMIIRYAGGRPFRLEPLSPGWRPFSAHFAAQTVETTTAGNPNQGKLFKFISLCPKHYCC